MTKRRSIDASSIFQEIHNHCSSLENYLSARKVSTYPAISATLSLNFKRKSWSKSIKRIQGNVSAHRILFHVLLGNYGQGLERKDEASQDAQTAEESDWRSANRESIWIPEKFRMGARIRQNLSCRFNSSQRNYRATESSQQNPHFPIWRKVVVWNKQNKYLWTDAIWKYTTEPDHVLIWRRNVMAWVRLAFEFLCWRCFPSTVWLCSIFPI